MIDPLGDLLKQYEVKAETKSFGTLPIVIRLDGKGFSKFTKKVKCKKPFDERLAKCMEAVTRKLVEYCDANIGYTQSDEITLILTKKSENSELFFGGRYQKLCSVLASYATYIFSMESPWDEMALFDCRVFEVPNREMAVDALVWRAEDCRRNSVSSMAQANFSHKTLQGKKTWEMKEMLRENGSPWEDVKDKYRDGIYVKRTKVKKKYTKKELKELPPKHHAHNNPNLEVERTLIKVHSKSIIDAKDKISFVF